MIRRLDEISILEQKSKGNKKYITLNLDDNEMTCLAVRRAQDNLIGLGFGSVPVITPEDLIISKFYPLRNHRIDITIWTI